MALKIKGVGLLWSLPSRHCHGSLAQPGPASDHACYDMMKKKTLQAPGGPTSEHVNATSANLMGQRKFYHRV
jgi:hypothetical protein